MTDLCLFWDLPFPTSTNRVWLFQELLSHAVIILYFTFVHMYFEVGCVTHVTSDCILSFLENIAFVLSYCLCVQVLHRVKQQIKQIRKGIKETGIWTLISNRPDVHSLIFQRESSEELNPQVSCLVFFFISF